MDERCVVSTCKHALFVRADHGNMIRVVATSDEGALVLGDQGCVGDLHAVDRDLLRSLHNELPGLAAVQHLPDISVLHSFKELFRDFFYFEL